MVKSAAKTVAQYLKELPAERRAVVSRVRELVRKNIPKGYDETMNWGMICYEIPLERYPETHNGLPLAAVALAAQKNCYAIYLMSIAMNPALTAGLKTAYKAKGRKPNMGKCCVRFRSLDDLPLPEIAKLVKTLSVKQYIEQYVTSRKK